MASSDPDQSNEMSSVVKIGPWGSSGTPYDIDASPLRLESITVRHGDVLDALAFSYKDSNNQSHTTWRWGGGGGDATTIQLGDSEYVTEVQGTYGWYYGHGGIAKLTLVTNVTSYGPFGHVTLDASTPFSVPVQNSSIVAFFASTGSLYVSSIGVYARPL